MALVKTLPFFFKSHTDSNNGGFPPSFPFHLYFDDELKMFRQKPTPELTDVLNEVYKNGSLVEGSISSESGKVYVEKIINYLFEHFNFNQKSTVLEVGFGSGILLKELKIKGVKNLTGIEPGDHPKVDGLEGVKLIKDFFPSPFISGQYDLIYSLLVLEHIEDPVEYIRELIKRVNINGKIIFGVPNCEPYLKEGDLSIFIHEHYSYFTKESIVNLVSKTDFKIEDISVIEGSFIVTISKNGKDSKLNYDLMAESFFTEKINIFTEKINTLFYNYKQTEIAIYAPTRALNYLFITKKTDVRLIDDNSELHGRYLPALTSRVESYEALVLNPPKCLLIFSRTFGRRLKQKCQSDDRLKHTLIVTLDDLDNN